jgi:hypothetical protein
MDWEVLLAVAQNDEVLRNSNFSARTSSLQVDAGQFRLHVRARKALELRKQSLISSKLRMSSQKLLQYVGSQRCRLNFPEHPECPIQSRPFP